LASANAINKRATAPGLRLCHRWPLHTTPILLKQTPARYAGFTLVEIMIVVCVIALLTIIAVPAFAKYRANSRRSVCIANLRQMENAKTVWAQENRKATSDAPGRFRSLRYR